VYNQYKLATQTIAINIQDPLHCLTAAKAGAHIVEIPTNVFLQMVNHQLTDIGICHFLSDWEVFLNDE
jgi:transaldolase